MNNEKNAVLKFKNKILASDTVWKIDILGCSTLKEKIERDTGGKQRDSALCSPAV